MAAMRNYFQDLATDSYYYSPILFVLPLFYHRRTFILLFCFIINIYYVTICTSVFDHNEQFQSVSLYCHVYYRYKTELHKWNIEHFVINYNLHIYSWSQNYFIMTFSWEQDTFTWFWSDHNVIMFPLAHNIINWL